MATPNPFHSKPQASPSKPAKDKPPAEPTREEIIAQQAANLKDVAGASQLYIAVSASIAPHISTEAFQIYRQTLLEQSGSPTDPIEVMMIEQIALAHFHIGRLHLKSCSTAHGPLSVAYADAATRLTAEFRRSALALEDYRAKQLARGQPADVGMVHAAEPAAQSTRERVKPRKKDDVAKIATVQNKETPWLKNRISPAFEASVN